MNGRSNGHRGRDPDAAGNLQALESLAEIQRPASVFTLSDDEAARMMSGAFWVERDQTAFWWKVPGCP